MPKAYIERVGEAEFKQKPIGAGPYRLVQYERGSRIVLEAFDQVLGRGARDQERHLPRSFPTPTARTAAVESGRADLAVQVPLREMTRLGKISGLVAEAAAVLRDRHADDAELRAGAAGRAGSAGDAAVDRQGGDLQGVLRRPRPSAQRAGHARARPATSRDYSFPFDKARAAVLLKQAGFGPDKPVGFPFLATNGAFPNDFDVARAIVGMWKAIGIQADLQEVTLAKYLDLQPLGDAAGPGAV